MKREILNELNLGENHERECKLATGGLPESIWETYSSFANTNGGTILLGIREHRDSFTVEGLTDKQIVKYQKDFWSTLNDRNKVSKNILLNHHVRPVTVGEKKILRIDVPAADRHDKPVYIGTDPMKGTYKRDYEGDFLCTEEAVRAMFADQRDVSGDVEVLDTYLQKITPKWNENFTNDVMNATDLPKQEDFYKHYLRGYDGKQRVIVIISDAFRYECAKELFGRLELDEKCTPKMESMLSSLPSVTSVGMASLLPHKEMQVDGNLNVNVDGQACASMEQKDKILKSYNENNVALSFDEVANANQTRIRELIQGKNIVYIYHNQVDARGDKPASENEVFNACAEAIEEIHKLVKKLTGYVSAPKFFITADHGFLYKRDRLQEFDKVTYPKDKCLYTNKRFLITEDAVNEQGIMARTMAYLNKLYVDTPVGADIFKVAGGGQNYVHGGTSLQEMIVPVIELTTNTRGVAYDYVDVVLTSVTRKVTNLITYFDFIQTEKVTDTMKARSIVAYFTTEDGEKISFDVPMIANSREDAPEKRTFHEKFTLKSREYKYGDKYYLVLADANDEKNILQQYEFMIDIAFVDDFGF